MYISAVYQFFVKKPYGFFGDIVTFTLILQDRNVDPNTGQVQLSEPYEYLVHSGIYLGEDYVYQKENNSSAVFTITHIERIKSYLKKETQLDPKKVKINKVTLHYYQLQ